MDGTELILDPSTGLWMRGDGAKYLRNEFDPDNPVWIDVTSDVWTYSFGGAGRRLDWSKGALPTSLVVDLQVLALDYLRTRAPTWSLNLQRLLPALAKNAAAHGIDLASGLGAISVKEWVLIWQGLNFESRTMVRAFYRAMSDLSMQGARNEIALELEDWVAWPQPAGMRDVLGWHKERGALTSAEAELVRRIFATSRPHETATLAMTRVWGWMLFETYKRPSQLLGMAKDALLEVQGQRPQFFLRVPKVKAQTGDNAALWPISGALASAIRHVSALPVIRELQDFFNRLVVLPGRKRIEGANGRTWDEAEYGLSVPMDWHLHGRVPTTRMIRAIDALFEAEPLMSPRTGRPLRLGAKRIRHTGGTKLAMQGTPLEDIQTIFEHDDPSSAQAYIDAVASELIPAVERSDRALGGLFAGLNEAFFRGKLVDKVGERPVFVPDFKGTPALVGSCGRNSACPTHPFWACYGGCPNFQAWRQADHSHSLTFVEREHARWSAAEAGKERSKLGKDFEQTFAGIIEVIHAIETERKS